MKRPVGLHFRLEHGLRHAIDFIVQTHMQCAQFFMTPIEGKTIQPTTEEINLVRSVRASQLRFLIAHGSYRINLASDTQYKHPVLEHEITSAKKLGCTHFLLHPGASQNLEAGLQTLGHNLNILLKREPELIFVLENVAFKNPSIGGLFEHFSALRSYLDQPEKIQFCIDTAHAFAAGYSFLNEQELQSFINQIEQNKMLENIALLHLNDTNSLCGSNIDQHAPFGQARLGSNTLKAFATCPELHHCPIILELPILPEIEVIDMLNDVASWK